MICSCDVRLSSLDREVLTLASNAGRAGLSDVQCLLRCSEGRARYILTRLVRLGYLRPSKTGGFIPSHKGSLEVYG